jgi:hypothetical protein
LEYFINGIKAQGIPTISYTQSTIYSNDLDSDEPSRRQRVSFENDIKESLGLEFNFLILIYMNPNGK